MFKKLHIKLTCYIGIILVAFLLITTTGIYHFTKAAYEYQMKDTMESEALKVHLYGQMTVTVNDFFSFNERFYNRNSESENRLVLPGESELEFNYITYDSAMNILNIESKDVELAEDIVNLAIDTLNAKQDIYDRVYVDDEEYRVYTKYVLNQGTPSVIQVYGTTSGESYIWRFLSYVLWSIGIIGAVILLVISYVFTGKALNPVKESWQKQREFVADASHELRTPLTVIQTNLDVMMADEEGTIEENALWLDNAHSETKIMANLIDQLLTLANVDSNAHSLEVTEISLSEIVEQISENFSMIASKKNIEFFTEIEENILMKGDYDKVRRLAVILIDNAVKYTENGSVTVCLKTEKNKKVLTVKDTGIGIADEDVVRIFDRFYRSDKARNRKFGGTGLGLSIAKWIAEIHKAPLEVNSKLGEGSIFTVRFN